jgi:ClpP class serine protease
VLQELADEIQSARAQKPVVAIANSLAASAAYWIGCAASEFYVTPGWRGWEHRCVAGAPGLTVKALDEAGVKTTLISAGKFKVEGNPYAPLDEDAQAFMQTRVDEYYTAFTRSVAKGRGVPIAQVRDAMGQGRVLGADAALAQGMVDGVASFDEVLRKMRKASKPTVAARASPSRLSLARNDLALL